MFSSNQLKEHKISELSENFIVYATTSQLVKTKGESLTGIKTRYKSLNDYTAKLPLLEKKEVNYLIGNTTESCINSGVINGVCYEIEGFISQYSLQNKDLTIILTGGDADFLAKRLKSTIFANSNFLLESLNLLSLYLNEND